MSRHTEPKFTVYYNKVEKRITIHKVFCKDIGKHGGIHQYEQGGYGYFVKKYEAEFFAEGLTSLINVRFTQCSHCKGVY